MTEKQKQQLSTRPMQRFISGDCGWRSAMHILTSRHFANKARAWRHVDLDRRSIFFTPMIEEGWSETEEFNGDHAVKLYYAFNRFDDSQARVVIQAMMLFSFTGTTLTVAAALSLDGLLPSEHEQ